MLVRNCAGGVVFHGDSVLILRNDKAEWVLPKGVIRPGSVSQETALFRVKHEAGVEAEITDIVGQTNYEFFSQSRQRPVNNRIVWYLMETDSGQVTSNKDEGFDSGDFYPIEEAIELITYSQDKSLVSLAYKARQELKALKG
ncbi:MAG: NUDIX hydrolase [Symbiobacteriaceae bacterium]|nr:NUDIX hydrolase [Symbiobacteriaceae bacterium]